MRKILLASAAMLGATTGLASAQNQFQGQVATPWAQGPATTNGNNSYAVPSTYQGNVKFPTTAAPAPGTVVIRLNGKVEVDMDAIWESGNHSAAPGAFKTNPVIFGSFMRLYPGVDGAAANGLRYGAAIELRQNFMSGNSYAPVTTITGTTATTSTIGTTASSASGNTSAQTVFVRRAFTYLASDQAGLIRFGTTDGVISLFDNCTFYSGCWDAGIGNFNGGQMQGIAPGAGVAVPFVWLAQAGAEYDNVKVVYLSPQFAGFDFGVQYAPSMGNGYTNAVGASPLQATVCNAASAGCISTTTGVDATRWYNQVGVGGRFQGDFGGVGVGAYAFYETAGKESGPFVSATALAPAARRAAGAAGFKYDNLSFVSAAAEVTAFGFTAAVDYIGGALNGQLAMRPQGGAPENGIVTGLTWRGGPLTLGVMTAWVDSQGSANLTKISQRHEWEVAFGGNYNVAPGLYLVGEYMYTQRHQGGFDFVANTATGATRDAKGQGILFSTVVNW